MPNKKSFLDISIVIVNYKSWNHLRNCLQSLEFSSPSFSFEIIVVDNTSNDGKLEKFKKEFSNVKFILNSGNNGFANGCNLGANHGLGEYLLFLNPDTIANQESILKMWQFAKKNPKVGITSCMQKKVNGGFEKSHRSFLKLSTVFGIFRAFSKKNTAQDASVIYSDWVSGSLVFISKEWLNQVNGWNEDYWMYFEDMDLSKKVQIANGKVVVLKDAQIIHNHGGASRINIKTASLTKTEVQISKHVYIQNHLKGFERFLTHLLVIKSNLFFKFILAVLGIPLFFIPKMRLNVYLFIKIVKYYVSSVTRRTWLSKNSMNAH